MPARTHAVGIDLGTTYSCISCLNEYGEPVTLPNQEGDMQTPSVILFDGDEVVVGREALRHAVSDPGHVVQNSKRFIGDVNKRWKIGKRSYTPVDMATFVLKKLLSAAQEKLQAPIDRAVITVPTQFSDLHRSATVEAGMRAGLMHVDVINEPIAASLCAVLGTEGLWFAELADDQRVMVFDLGGGTFDLSLVKYAKNEVRVLMSDGDLELGGTDWNSVLLEAVCDQFKHDFKEDPRTDAESYQFVALEVEEAKRSLSVRERAPLVCHHAGHRKVYKISRENFEKISERLVERTASITERMLFNNEMGWAHVDVVMMVGGATRMPMIRRMLKDLSGRTINTSMSPDQSIAHGAAYYAGMLVANTDLAKIAFSVEATKRLSQLRQKSINSRSLGILIRDLKANTRVPYYLVKAGTELPASGSQVFGTVVPGQKLVRIHVIESGTTPDQPYVELGMCMIEDLPEGLQPGSKIEVTFTYDDQARVHVQAKHLASGHEATLEIVRPETVVTRSATGEDDSLQALNG